jgi:hypothetical protein
MLLLLKLMMLMNMFLLWLGWIWTLRSCRTTLASASSDKTLRLWALPLVVAVFLDLFCRCVARYTLWLWLTVRHGKSPFLDGLPTKNGDFPWRSVSHNQRVANFCFRIPKMGVHWESCGATLLPLGPAVWPAASWVPPMVPWMAMLWWWPSVRCLSFSYEGYLISGDQDANLALPACIQRKWLLLWLQPDVSEWTVIGNMYGLQNWYIQIFHLVKLYATTCYWAVVLISERMMPVSMGSRECAAHQTMASSWRLRLEAQYISRCHYWALGDADLSELPATGCSALGKLRIFRIFISFWEEDLEHFCIH